jgi:UDP-2,3-diacylglucosamine pyrophosphatase LpxH
MAIQEREVYDGPHEAQPAYDRLKAYVISDVHLNNHPYDRETEPENPRRRNFRMFLAQVNDALRPSDKVQLILNGDILDITGSWFEEVMPWDAAPEAIEKIVCDLVLQIVENNQAAFDEIRKLLQHPLSEVIYIYGNHDGLLQKYPKSRQVLREALAQKPADQERLHFTEHFESRELELYVSHGHLLDPFNYSFIFDPPMGDVINLLIINRFLDWAVDRLKENGYSEEFTNKVHARLHDLEYLRPLSLIPVWVDSLANEFMHDPENRGKLKSVKTILIETISEILHEPKMTKLAVERLHMPKAFLSLLVKAMLRIPSILPVISFITSKLVSRSHSNKPQYQAAQKIYREKGYRLIAFGHTHIPTVQPLSQNAYYFNTGSWKPVINLFKQPLDPVELEYLNPDVQFNKVERCGILRIEKKDFTGRIPTEFALQTIQSGLS